MRINGIIESDLTEFSLTGNIIFYSWYIPGFIKSDLEIPDSISRYLSLYLMMAIGFKGGVAIANTPDVNG